MNAFKNCVATDILLGKDENLEPILDREFRQIPFNKKIRVMPKIISILLLLFTNACSQQPVSEKQAVVSDAETYTKPPLQAPPLKPETEVQTQALEMPAEAVIPPTPDAVDSKPIPIASIWPRLFTLYALPKVDNRRIRQEIQWLMKNPDYLDRVQKRAEPFLHYIVEQIETHGLPGEIALLPIVESAFRPYAISQHEAAGIWQFIPETGLRYGLEQNWWYDGRRDVYDSTQAAIRYLKKLEQRFDGDWLLALAAYNSGENKVGRAIKRNRSEQKKTDFWSLELPVETRAYVPRLIALSQFIAEANSYGVMLRYIPDQPVFKPVDIGAQLDLALAAQLADVSIEQLFRLNPGFKRWATHPEGPHRLLLPIDKAGIFESRLIQLSQAERIGQLEHSVKKGENIGKIAERYGTSAAAVIQLNQPQDGGLRVGQILTVPVPIRKLTYYQRPGIPASAIDTSLDQGTEQLEYTVKSGDTLWDIAQNYSVSTQNLARWNNLTPENLLHPGQKLIVASNLENGESKLIDYTVKKGDSLFVIARRLKVKISDLRRWNAEKLGKYLIPGQKLICVCGS